jgi:AraC family transcriptional regulator
MNHQDTNSARQMYISRLNKVLDYIHANLEQPLSLNVLAGVAGFSPFHFHRIFKSLVGETLGDYIQRARLEKSANMLLNRPGDNILEIALNCGFSSAAIFSRAFKAHFGTSPSQFRRQEKRKLGKVESKSGKDLFSHSRYNKGSFPTTFEGRIELPMDVEVKLLPTFHVAYIRHIYGYSKGVFSNQIGEAFQHVRKWAGARDLMGPHTLVIGIPYDNPDITPNDRCRYDACVTVPAEITNAEGEIGIQDIAGGKYAVCRIEVSTSGTYTIGETVDRLYGEWLPGSGYQVDDGPPLEIYHDSTDKPPGTWIGMDYCVPIKPL